ncbi:hypothetical protein HerbRD11066_78620 [Herbidospora sp. RD11066]
MLRATPWLTERHGYDPTSPVPNPQSQSFSQSYGSVLPTSLTYFALSKSEAKRS